MTMSTVEPEREGGVLLLQDAAEEPTPGRLLVTTVGLKKHTSMVVIQ